MTVKRSFYPEVRLKRLVGEAGGMRAADAVEQAALRLEDIRESCLAAIDAKIELVHGLAKVVDESGRARCYCISNEIFAEAGSFGLPELSEAAHSLCVLLSATERRAAPEAAIRVHVDAMRALRRPEIAGNKMLRAAVLKELQTLTARLAGVRTP